ncbi:hypothetical protein BC628DRAFT_1401879 [Trametes gibbosa]|nr:hypothetical protein BC628DRAFT_1401879 [Trametes gibbosa]
MLNICIDIASLIAPRDAALTMPVLNRPDPSLQSLIVPSERPEIVRCAIDWQGVAILPFIMSSGLPRAVRSSEELIPMPSNALLPAWPDYFDELPEEDREVVRIHQHYACRHLHYRNTLDYDHLRASY